jgi:hypothetical protein
MVKKELFLLKNIPVTWKFFIFLFRSFSIPVINHTKSLFMELKETLTQIALKWGYKMEEISPGIFGLDISIKRKTSETIRYQYVTVRFEELEGAEKKIYLSSRSGICHSALNFHDLLKESLFCNYCTVALLATKDKEGNPNESLIVQAAPYEKYTSPELLDNILFEVANNADYIEEKYFGGDKY